MKSSLNVDVGRLDGASLPADVARRPHIVVVIPRGEAVRNFLYSDTLPVLAQNARVTLLSVLHDETFQERFAEETEAIHPLQPYDEHPTVVALRGITSQSHFRWLWSEVAKNHWEIHDSETSGTLPRIRREVIKAGLRLLANRPALRALTSLTQAATYHLRPTGDFDRLFAELAPDLIFNGSHVHGLSPKLPLMVAHRMGIPTAAFVFSWDNLTSRSRILEPYDYYLVWHDFMRTQLLDIYPAISPEHVFVTGTPQFDFHFKPQFLLSRDELAQEIGFDPERPFILYTTGVGRHFPEEHRHVQFIADWLQGLDSEPKPQLVVRMYVKGTTDEMKALAENGLPNTLFPPILWDKHWVTPRYEDLAIYTSLLRHAAMGINAASTVSLELMMHDKPVLNLGFDPPGSNLPHPYRWARHIDFDHYRPVAESGGVMVARSTGDVRRMIRRGLEEPQAGREARRRFIHKMFGRTLDGQSGERVGRELLKIVRRQTAEGVGKQ